MNDKTKKRLVTESIWLLAILTMSAILEYVIIAIFDLHPVLSVKIQGIIGLLIFGYGVRMVSRVLGSYKVKDLESG